MSTEAAIALAQSKTNSEDTSSTDESSTQSTDTDGQDTTSVDEEGGNDTSSNSEESTDAGESGDQDTSIETYADFILPENVTMDTELLDKAVPLFKELKLNQEQAQKLVDFQSEFVQASQQGQAEAFNQLKLDWQEQTKSDSEIGGDNFEESVSDARAALEKFGTPELTKLLNDFGIGNHPEMIRAWKRVGALLKEDIPGSTGAATSEKKDRVSILYPSFN